jgi:hypothetical protein
MGRKKKNIWKENESNTKGIKNLEKKNRDGKIIAEALKRKSRRKRF